MKYLVYLLAVCLSGLFCGNTKKDPGKAKGKDWLFSYEGTKKNDSILISNDGYTVLYQRGRNVLRVTAPQKPAWQLRMEKELAATKARRGAMIKRIAGSVVDPSDLPSIRLTMMAIDEIETHYRQALENTILLPEPGVSFTLARSAGRSGPDPGEEGEPDNWQEVYNALNADIAALTDVEKIPLPDPPEWDVSICYYCDSLAKKRMEKKRDQFIEMFVAREKRIWTRTMELYHFFDVLESENPEAVTAAMREARKSMQHNIFLADFRMERLLHRLVIANRGNLMKIITLMPLSIGLSRKRALLGEDDLVHDVQLGELMRASHVNEYIKKLVAEEDYDRCLDISWILSADRQLQLLNGESIMEQDGFQMLLDFNRFRLSVTADAKDRGDDFFSKARVESEPAYYKAIPTRECRFLFVQSSGEKTVGVGQPLLKLKLVDAACSEGTYVGTRDWIMIDPFIQVGFCSDDDTIRLFPIIPNLRDRLETWQTDDGPKNTGYAMQLFSDGFENNSNYIDPGDEMLDQLVEIQKFTTSLSSAAEITNNFIALQRGYSIVATIKQNFAMNAVTLVPVTARNKSSILFDRLFNGKLTTSSQQIVYANMWIRLTHLK